MGGRRKRVTTGYRYGLTMHMGICHGPVDNVSKIEVDDRVAWWGEGSYPADPPTSTVWKYISGLLNIRSRGSPPQGAPVTESAVSDVSAASLFGGDKKEGGLSGTLRINMGEPDQEPDPVLVAALGNPQPAYRGILSLVYKGLVTSNNPYLKAWAVTVQRNLKGWQNDEPWYPEKATINTLDMNPAHIIYQCLTDPDWGMGYPSSALDDNNFRDAADVLHDEGFGLSLMWNQQSEIQSFLQIIYDHIGGALRVNPRIGLYQLKLIRYDYDPDDLPIFDDSTISELQSFQRAGWGETINELTVTYTDPLTRQDTSVTVHNLANIQAQGAVISQKINYSGICSYDLAQRVAMRDLSARSLPLGKCRFTVNRRAWKLQPADVFKLVWPKLGIAGVVMRVINVSTGTLESGLITVEAVEDVFGLPANTYLTEQESGWVDPQSPPIASPLRYLTELTWYDLCIALSPADLATVEPDDGYLAMFATAPAADYLDYDLQTSVHDADDFTTVDTAPYIATCIVVTALVIEEHTTVEVLGLDFTLLEQSDYAIIDSEYVRIDDFDIDASTLTFARGVLDTVPAEHDAGSILLVADGNFSSEDGAGWPVGAEVDTKVVTRKANGVLPVEDAPIDTLIVQARHNKPYPPGLFRINGDYMPTSVENTITVSWVHRNRISQDSHLIAQDETSIAPEVGQTYGIRIYDQDEVLCRTLTGLTGESYTYPLDEEFADCGGTQTHLRIELYSERDGLESWQSHSHRFERVYTGFGYGFGNNWGE